MLADLLSDLTLPRWEQWLAPALGVTVFGLLMWFGRSWLGPRSTGEAKGQTLSVELSAQARERRRSDRRAGLRVGVLITNDEQTAEPIIGWVVNRSRGGMRLAVDQALATTGMVLSVRPRTAPATMSWVRVEVRRTRVQGTTTHLHCKFLQTPPNDVLLLFG